MQYGFQKSVRTMLCKILLYLQIQKSADKHGLCIEIHWYEQEQLSSAVRLLIVCDRNNVIKEDLVVIWDLNKQVCLQSDH